jgi:hypothetical protein
MLAAQITEVKIGHLSLEGLLFDDGRFGVAVPQIGVKFLNQDIQNTTARDLKRLLGKDSKTSRIEFIECRTAFNKNKTLALNLEDFQKIITLLDRAGHKPAQDFRDALFGLSLHQLFCDAFGVKFEAEDRQQWMISRQTHRENFHPLLTQWLKADAGGDSSKVCWGKAVNYFKAAAGLPITPVEQYNYAQLAKMNIAEAMYNQARSLGFTHEKALDSIEANRP